MSNTQLPAFIPDQPPASSILDFSGTLSQGSISSLQSQAGHLYYKTKVVILPQDFSPPDLQQFSLALAKKWHVSGDRFLLAVDLKGHKVRGISGESLKQQGVDSSYITNELFPQHFLPYIRHGDVYGAISSTLTAVNNTVVTSRTTAAAAQSAGSSVSRTGTAYAPNSAPAGGADGEGFVGLIIISAIILAFFGLSFRFRQSQNKKLHATIEQESSSLYEKADQLGQASEYMNPSTNKELAQRVAAFFAKLTTLEKARAEIEHLEKRNKPWKAGKGLEQCLRLTRSLVAEMDPLLEQVNRVTGSVETFPAAPREDAKRLLDGEESAPVLTVRETPYRQPVWVNDPVYAPAMPSLSSAMPLLGMVMLFNQMETNHRLNEMQHQLDHSGAHGGGSDGGSNGGFMHHHQSDDSSWGSGGGDWGGSSSDTGGAQTGGGDWGGGQSDFGSGGDFGGGDGGADWGGGGDIGGGGDFGGGDGGGGW